MPRPRLKKLIRWQAHSRYFKPRGIPLHSLQEITLTEEEIETLRLKDALGLDQTSAAKKMNTSQSTFQRLLTSARNKTATALTKGYALKIEEK